MVMNSTARRDDGGDVLFREVQTWRGSWAGPVLLFAGVLIVVMFGYAMFVQLILGTPVGDRPAPDLVLAILGSLMLTLGAGLVFLVLQGRLVTEVRASILCVQHFPLTRRHCFSYTEISECEARRYRPIREYGGWGVRMGLFGRGKAYNVSGNSGVQLVFTDGRRLLIGSRRAAQLSQAIADTKRTIEKRSR